jgi:glucoamylase
MCLIHSSVRSSTPLSAQAKSRWEKGTRDESAGRAQVAGELLRVMEFSTEGGQLIPEQVWDAADIPARELFSGKPTFAACPLAWAHSEYIKLRRSLHDGRIFDQPPQPFHHYVVEKRESPNHGWGFDNKCRTMPQGKTLRISLPVPALVHWSFDGWRTTHDTETVDTGLGLHAADLPTARLTSGTSIVFTFYWPQQRRWEGVDSTVVVENA